MIVRTQEDVKVIALVGGVDRGCGHLSCSIITIVVRLLLASNIFEIIHFVMVCVSLRAYIHLIIGPHVPNTVLVTLY